MTERIERTGQAEGGGQLEYQRTTFVPHDNDIEIVFVDGSIDEEFDERLICSNGYCRRYGHSCHKRNSSIKNISGGFVDGQGQHVPEGQSKVFMATNLCPDEYPNLSWCSQRSSNGYVNQYGYGEHFDLEKGNNQLGDWQGKNPEVTWEWSDCNGPHNQDSRTPNDRMYHQCFCGRHPDG
ncbi:endoglucanase-like [Mercenaria mercenaria]|uniref:endoglucanase-like n=1 Tax=Mercenaria mercenaria TaxID=6596 RepID=UPI00234FAA4C|nr:endoglucanase-like [Mercenaria mercenaria]